MHVSKAFKTNSNNFNFDPLLNFQSASNDNYMHCLCTNICAFHTFCLTNECKTTGNAAKMTVNVKMLESLYLYLQYIISLTYLHLYVYLLAIIQCLFAVFSFNCFFFLQYIFALFFPILSSNTCFCCETECTSRFLPKNLVKLPFCAAIDDAFQVEVKAVR